MLPRSEQKLTPDRPPMRLGNPANRERRFRVLNVVNGYSRKCAGQIVDISITGEHVSRRLDQMVTAWNR